MKIRTGDIVSVIAGKDRGKKGKVLQVFPRQERASVEGVNLAVKHLKKRGTQPGQKIEFPAPIHLSNLMAIDPKHAKPTRVGYRLLTERDGRAKKVRIAKKSGEVIV